MKNKAQGSDGHEAARLLVAWLEHVEAHRRKRASEGEERIVVVLPDAEVAERKRNAVPPAAAGRAKKRAKSHR